MASTRSRSSPGRGSSARSTLASGMGWDVGGASCVASAATRAAGARMAASGTVNCSISASDRASRASCATWTTSSRVRGFDTPGIVGMNGGSPLHWSKGANCAILDWKSGEVRGTRRAGELLGMRVLLVEDETRLANEVRRGLEAEGFSVDVAADGKDGFWRASEGRYDAIVLDIMLPGMNGFKVCSAL